MCRKTYTRTAWCWYWAGRSGGCSLQAWVLSCRWLFGCGPSTPFWGVYTEGLLLFKKKTKKIKNGTAWLLRFKYNAKGCGIVNQKKLMVHTIYIAFFFIAVRGDLNNTFDIDTGIFFFNVKIKRYIYIPTTRCYNQLWNKKNSYEITIHPGLSREERLKQLNPKHTKRCRP